MSETTPRRSNKILENTGYKGFRSFEVEKEIIDTLYKTGYIENWNNKITLYPNMYIELKNLTNPKQTVLGKVNKTANGIEKLKESSSKLEIKPRNREQVFALDALMDDSITVVVLTGTAGSGKTLLALQAALDKIQKKIYSKTIITRPMSQVGKYELGILPGDIKDKFQPYLIGYMSNLEQFTDGNQSSLDYIIDGYKFEMVPLQLFRGASFNKTIVLADEMQVIDNSEMLTIGTRIGEGSKLVIMGDLNQRDEDISKEKTGLHKLMNDTRMKESPLVAIVELQKCERSQTAQLFSQVFEE